VGKVDYSLIKSSIDDDLLKLTNNLVGSISVVGVAASTHWPFLTSTKPVQRVFSINNQSIGWAIDGRNNIKIEQILIEEVNIAIDVSWP